MLLPLDVHLGMRTSAEHAQSLYCMLFQRVYIYEGYCTHAHTCGFEQTYILPALHILRSCIDMSSTVP